MYWERVTQKAVTLGTVPIPDKYQTLRHMHTPQITSSNPGRRAMELLLLFVPCVLEGGGSCS